MRAGIVTMGYLYEWPVTSDAVASLGVLDGYVQLANRGRCGR